MSTDIHQKVALVYPGNPHAREGIVTATNRFANLFEALAAAGIPAEPVIWHDDVADEVKAQLMGVQAALESPESEWIQLLCERVGLAHDKLPLLWDCDFMVSRASCASGSTSLKVTFKVVVELMTSSSNSSRRSIVNFSLNVTHS